MSTNRARQVAAAVRAIRDFHALGRQIPPKRPAKEGYGQGDLRAAAEQLGVSVEYARQARQFADPDIGYTRDELNELCVLIKEVQPDQDDTLAVFGRTHVVRVLTVPKRHRVRLQREAIENGWSTNRLEAEIGARYGTRRGGGRGREMPGDGLGLLVVTEKMCETWRRWLDKIDVEEGDDPGHATLADVPDELRRQLRSAGRTLRTLHRAVTDELKTRRPGREVRPVFRDPVEDGSTRQ